MPGSPPTRSTDPGTSPPPHTRSNSGIPTIDLSTDWVGPSRVLNSNFRPRARSNGTGRGDGFAFFRDGVPRSARVAFSTPFRGNRAAVLANVSRGAACHYRVPLPGQLELRMRQDLVTGSGPAFWIGAWEKPWMNWGLGRSYVCGIRDVRSLVSGAERGEQFVGDGVAGFGQFVDRNGTANDVHLCSGASQIVGNRSHVEGDEIH